MDAATGARCNHALARAARLTGTAQLPMSDGG
jgi:hypothetical protein